MTGKYYWWWSADEIMERGPIIKDWVLIGDHYYCVTKDTYIRPDGTKGSSAKIAHFSKDKTFDEEDNFDSWQEAHKKMKQCLEALCSYM